MRECSVPQACLTLCDPTDYSQPGSSVHGLFPRQEYWNELPLPPPGDLHSQGSKRQPLPRRVGSLPLSHLENPIISLRDPFITVVSWVSGKHIHHFGEGSDYEWPPCGECVWPLPSIFLAALHSALLTVPLLSSSFFCLQYSGSFHSV